jgi:hypothetical protein
MKSGVLLELELVLLVVCSLTISPGFCALDGRQQSMGRAKYRMMVFFQNIILSP